MREVTGRSRGLWAGASALLCAFVSALSACAGARPQNSPSSASEHAAEGGVAARAASSASVSPSGVGDASLVPATDAQPLAQEPADAHWLLGESSTSRAFPPVAPRCLAAVGCPFAPARLPVCASAIRGTSFKTPSELAQHVGTLVTLSGTLKAFSLATLSECGSACCNQAGGDILLIPSALPFRENGIGLVADGQPRAFSCRGDESKVCCGIATGQDTLVQGTLLQDQAHYVLKNPKLCQPADITR